jgi:uncharacterized small protein (TIGR04563 family)
MTGAASKKKLTLYFPEGMLKEAAAEARRQDRSISWILQAAWKVARRQIQSFPSTDVDVPLPDGGH